MTTTEFIITFLNGWDQDDAACAVVVVVLACFVGAMIWLGFPAIWHCMRATTRRLSDED